jgi:NAD(P)H dehydrogenase (quinone)
MQPILIFGATGDQGHSLMRQLVAAGYRVRAATRDPSAFPAMAFPGVDAVAADFTDQASLDAAAAGCAGIVMHLPFTFDRAYARLMGENIGLAGRRAGVGKIVFHTSCVVRDHDLGIAGHDGRRDIEAALAASGVPHVFIRSAVFMDNMVRAWVKPAIVARGVFAYPCKPDLAISWTSQEDIAAYMIAAFRDPALLADRFTVGGPEALTGDQVAARLSRAIGRPIRFQSLDPDAFAGAMSQLVTGSPDFQPGSLYDRMAEFYRWYNAQPESPLAIDLRPVLAVLPVRPTPLLVWAGQHDWNNGEV